MKRLLPRFLAFKDETSQNCTLKIQIVVYLEYRDRQKVGRKSEKLIESQHMQKRDSFVVVFSFSNTTLPPLKDYRPGYRGVSNQEIIFQRLPAHKTAMLYLLIVLLLLFTSLPKHLRATLAFSAISIASICSTVSSIAPSLFTTT